VGAYFSSTTSDFTQFLTHDANFTSTAWSFIFSDVKSGVLHPNCNTTDSTWDTWLQVRTPTSPSRASLHKINLSAWTKATSVLLTRIANAIQQRSISHSFPQRTPSEAKLWGSKVCLNPASSNRNISNRLFAMELDTYRNYEFNVSVNINIGVDVNNMKFNHRVHATTFILGADTDCFTNCGTFEAWIT
jgi:hypothetical protein